MGHSVFGFIVAIGILVFIHEFGHFIVARLCGVGVDVFCLGFGPKIFKKKIGHTEYCVAAIPLGGYVKMVGEEPGTTLDPEDHHLSFTHKSLLKKSLIVAAGPVFNFLLAILIFYMFFQISGIKYQEPIAGEVLADTPAFNAGIQVDDKIIKINSTPISSFDDILVFMSENKGNPITLTVERGTQVLDFPMTPTPHTVKNIFDEDVQVYRIGIGSSDITGTHKLNPIQALGYSLEKSWNLTTLTIVSFGKMIAGKISPQNMGGPILIAQIAGKQAKKGFADFMGLIAYLSISLGIINLFPIPVLDGGHLLFFAIEGITGREMNEQIREKMIQFGAAMLVALMVFVFYNDIIRIVKGS